MSTFDPDKPYVKIRGMGSVNYIQDNKRYTSGFKYIGKATKDGKVIAEEREDVRNRARQKIANKAKNSLKDFRTKETPDAVSSAIMEDKAAKSAEEKIE